ncbi:hypothetical protein DB88DRAFT_494179 [Papiliotrema laurentii]|uniref:Protein YIP n=1 Tax=Papiliotrema laurentii TaxID=5418 RepID=A0AAD9CZ05_PAPLA|nr:hypothetical protein DB88DRAFT_494179 [Papiliotrema laurentii]
MSQVQGGYAVVDVDDDSGSGQQGGLEFKTFLGDENARSTSQYESRPDVPYNPFNIAYYQSYFDVDTTTVLKRVGLAMIPREGFVADACEGHVDLYGSFWTLTTLVLTLYTTSTLSASITQYLAVPDAKAPSNLPLLSTATSVVYAYGLVVPALLWAATTWLGVGSWSVVEALGIYGYGMGIFVPISLLCLIPVGILRWVLVGMAAMSSGYFIFRNTYPVLASADNKMLRFLIIAVVGLHAVMALAMKVLFFSYSVGGVNLGPDPGLSEGQ